MSVAAWILALAPVPLLPDEFHERCAALASSSAVERAAAERWLSAHLAAERYPDLVAVARGADAEVRARLVRILAADPRHLELSLELAAEATPELAGLGADALRASLAVLEPTLGEPARRGAELRSTLERMAGNAWPRLLVLESGRPLGEVLLELEFSGMLGLGLTLEPELATRVPRAAGEVFIGPWEEALDLCLRAYGLMLEGHGLPKGREADTREGGFLRVFVGESERTRNGVEQVAGWMLAVARTGGDAARVQAARNLAATGLGPVLSWLGRRAAAGDEAALEGVLLAGALGALVEPLFTPEFLERLLAEARAGGARSALALATLSELPGSPERRARVLAWLRGTPAEQWVALHVAERAGWVDARVGERARELLAAAETPAVLRLQALFTLARCAPEDGAAPVLVGGLELMRLADRADERVRLARTLAAAQIAPPARDPAEFARVEREFELGTRLALAEAWLWNGDAVALGAHLVDWVTKLGSGEPKLTPLLAEVLRAGMARGAGERVQRALDEGRKGTKPAARALDRLELLLGLVPAAEVEARLAAGGWLLTGPEADLALLGALAGYPVPIAREREARETLHGALAAALGAGPTRSESSELFAALERAAGGLFAAGRDEEGAAFAARVRTAVRRGPKGGELRKRVELELWPPAPLMSVRDVRGEFDGRRLPDGW